MKSLAPYQSRFDISLLGTQRTLTGHRGCANVPKGMIWIIAEGTQPREMTLVPNWH